MTYTVNVYSKPHCSACTATKKFLGMKNVPFEERELDEGTTSDLLSRGYTAAPAVEVLREGERAIFYGGFDHSKLKHIVSMFKDGEASA